MKLGTKRRGIIRMIKIYKIFAGILMIVGLVILLIGGKMYLDIKVDRESNAM